MGYWTPQAAFRCVLTSAANLVINPTHKKPEPEHDPELSQNGIEFASRLLSKSPVTVLSLQPSDAAEFLFLFTLRVLDGKEPLPKGAAADFWVRDNPTLAFLYA